MKPNTPPNITAVIESAALLNSAEACAFLRISRPTLKRWVRDGRIRPKRTPTGMQRFDIASLEKLIS